MALQPAGLAHDAEQLLAVAVLGHGQVVLGQDALGGEALGRRHIAGFDQPLHEVGVLGAARGGGHALRLRAGHAHGRLDELALHVHPLEIELSLAAVLDATAAGGVENLVLLFLLLFLLFLVAGAGQGVFIGQGIGAQRRGEGQAGEQQAQKGGAANHGTSRRVTGVGGLTTS